MSKNKILLSAPYLLLFSSRHQEERSKAKIADIVELYLNKLLKAKDSEIKDLKISAIESVTEEWEISFLRRYLRNLPNNMNRGDKFLKEKLTKINDKGICGHFVDLKYNVVLPDLSLIPINNHSIFVNNDFEVYEEETYVNFLEQKYLTID
ncbi:hypothetical protein CLU97_4747 [Chryseobacterium sp. 7]|jgi:hypothetical protein|uniref:hypothetical protein n=1 Tax=Chryseobacterium sp. 7 TaxID=2035214 RepID=UPI000EB10C79|nr:hypothetical protein [Chryseobacterium sp. 7]RLJ22905.1 hypothetical protein CLU97_4714 [Chryseobacterium sp. 7]RLJ22934.1 hypothetical protein CLU97_4747 [Chryseobacterium sp. 7]